ncbi:DUF885 domain-containing protein [Saccharomonospora piscinae]|uniref:DUF885 domain-containing protein n=1 Tax=Saccharomonospora piscinae TaxID=687388 RepID=UPI0018CC13A4|nr:DUF885 domain-containing protein [Saccharomonospora piscinae]
MQPVSSVTALADEFVDLLFETEPLSAVLLGVDTTRTGLGDVRETTEQEYRAALERLVQRATAIEPDGLGGQDRITREVLINQANSRIAQLDTRQVEFTISDLFVAPAPGLLTLLPMVSVRDAEEGRAQLDRLSAIPAFLERHAERHRAGVAAGRTPVARLVRASVDHIDRYLAEPDNDPLSRQTAPDADFAALRDEVLRDVVRPAFAAYRDVLRDEILAHGRPDDRPGLCHLPNGDAVYAALARVHTTTDRGPEDLHQTGLDCLARLADEYAEIGGRALGTTDLGEIFTRLRTDPELRWKDADDLLDTARAAIVRAEREAPNWFGHIPPQPWVVEPVPAADAPGAPGAFYVQSPADGSRPGTYFANTHQVTERFRHTAEATAFHEVIPGHHFQISTALNLTDLPMLRRISDCNAYIEGWGLYTERLAVEMGLYSDDVALLGMLSMDSVRASRLVVDTGLHALGWTRQQAIDFMERNTPMAMVEIVAEVDRYISYPGQALSYMVGRLEIQRLRAEAAAALGERFDVREFHDLVLGGGALPMTVLEGAVRDWVAARR